MLLTFVYTRGLLLEQILHNIIPLPALFSDVLPNLNSLPTVWLLAQIPTQLNVWFAFSLSSWLLTFSLKRFSLFLRVLLIPTTCQMLLFISTIILSSLWLSNRPQFLIFKIRGLCGGKTTLQDSGRNFNIFPSIIDNFRFPPA